jgi:hypothetical protein
VRAVLAHVLPLDASQAPVEVAAAILVDAR